MKKSTLYRLCVLLLASVCLQSSARAQNSALRPEMRAFWADAFNPAFKSPEECDLLLQRLHNAHCNAIFAQMRKGGDAYYVSRYEPWAKDDTVHFDALAYLIAKAHAMQPPIAVHAWINTCAVGGNGKNPLNIVALHPDWLSLNPKNADFDGEATKIDPGNPDAADWTFHVYLDVVRHYPVDGVQFDFVRYGGAEWGYNPVSLARFRQQYGNGEDIQNLPDTNLPAPADPSWKQWRRDQVTALVRKVYAHAVAIKPDVVISADVITWADAPKTEEEWSTKTAAMNRVYQDWRSWLREGILDLACPMTYFQADTHTDWQRHWSETIKDHQYRRAATVGVGTWFNTIPQSLELMEISRARSEKGNWPYGVVLYSYAGTGASDAKDTKGKRTELTYQPEFYAGLSTPVDGVPHSAPFTSDVPIPTMPWKLHPDRGHLKGFILTGALGPVDGAKVTLRAHGKALTQRTDGTGFYAFIDVPPGRCTVIVNAPGYTAVKQEAAVKPGEVTTVGVTLGGSAIPLTARLATLNEPPAVVGTPVRLEKLTVTLGSDTFPGNLYAVDSDGRGIRIRPASRSILPLQPGDVISVMGVIRAVDEEPVIDEAIVRLTDIKAPGDLPASITITGKELAAGTLSPGSLIRADGTVTAAAAAGLTLDVDGVLLEVPLAGHKAPWVEATDPGVAMPAIGTQVRVQGVLGRAQPQGGKTHYRLHLTGPEALTPLPVAAFWKSPWAQAVALICFRRPAPGMDAP